MSPTSDPAVENEASKIVTPMKLDPAADVAVSKSFPLSKTKAVMLLRMGNPPHVPGFRNAGLQNVTTPDDTKAGIERWRVYCLGDYARRLGVVEVAGPREALPKAVVVASFRRLGVEVGFGYNARNVPVVTFKPIPPPEPTPTPEPVP